MFLLIKDMNASSYTPNYAVNHTIKCPEIVKDNNGIY